MDKQTNTIDLAQSKQSMYELIRQYHFDKFGCFGNQHEAWDYFGSINKAGLKILRLVRNQKTGVRSR